MKNGKRLVEIIIGKCELLTDNAVKAQTVIDIGFLHGIILPFDNFQTAFIVIIDKTETAIALRHKYTFTPGINNKPFIIELNSQFHCFLEIFGILKRKGIVGVMFLAVTAAKEKNMG